jgi:hypothetical protein
VALAKSSFWTQKGKWNVETDAILILYNDEVAYVLGAGGMSLHGHVAAVDLATNSGFLLVLGFRWENRLLLLLARHCGHWFVWTPRDACDGTKDRTAGWEIDSSIPISRLRPSAEQTAMITAEMRTCDELGRLKTRQFAADRENQSEQNRPELGEVLLLLDLHTVSTAMLCCLLYAQEL